MSDSPRVSILIPNFNNGRQSSRNQAVDLLGDLLDSLRDTLKDDPTPHEIIAFDDGSTDDSLDTLRRWRDDGFLKLIEAEHCGVLAKTANQLVAASRGDILVRLDGDITVLTPNWVSKLCAVFDQGPENLGVVGPKQLVDGAQWVHSFGDFVLHPKGYHHLHQGAPRHRVTRPAEVDHVMGCFYCCKREVHDRLGGYDENILRGQTVEFGMRARLEGYRCFAVPHIEFVHRHSLRDLRANHADTEGGIDNSRESFRKKWGFDRISADLDVVRERYAGTPLLWNADVFGLPADEAYTLAPGPSPSIETSLWKRYGEDQNFRRQIDFRVNVAGQIAGQHSGGRSGGHTGPLQIGVIGAAEGLILHLLAQQGLAVEGCETSRSHVDLGQQFLKSKTYAGQAPSLVHQPDPRTLPWADASLDFVFWPTGIGRHPNPTPIIAEAKRVMRPDAVFAVAASPESYLAHELAVQVRSVNDWTVPTPQKTTHPSQPTVVLAARDAAVFENAKPVAA
ncbi:MAG: glycosyltransferase [Planctomycetota bacterium]